MPILYKTVVKEKLYCVWKITALLAVSILVCKRAPVMTYFIHTFTNLRWFGVFPSPCIPYQRNVYKLWLKNKTGKKYTRQSTKHQTRHFLQNNGYIGLQWAWRIGRHGGSWQLPIESCKEITVKILHKKWSTCFHYHSWQSIYSHHQFTLLTPVIYYPTLL